MGMMPVAKIGDTVMGSCKIHGPQIGFIQSGKPLTTINGIPDATIQDIVIASCGHMGHIISGNYTDFDHMLPVARMGDKVIGIFSGTITSGSPNTIS